MTNDAATGAVGPPGGMTAASRPNRERSLRYAVLALAALALVARVALLLVSAGSNDVIYWEAFADSIRLRGLIATYEMIPIFNHPPLAGYYAAAAKTLAIQLGLPFPILLKVLPFAADLGAAWILYRLARPRGAVAAAGALAAYLWSPVAILVVCYHGNTDAVLAAFFLLAAVLADRDRPVAAGLALAAALNVKIVALFAAPAILLRPRAWRDRCKAGFAFALGLVTFVPVLLAAGRAFYRNAIAYNSNLDEWGIVYVLRHVSQINRLGALGERGLITQYAAAGRWVMLAAVVAIGVAGAGGRIPAVRTAAASMAAFLFLAPGFGVQYCIWPLPLLFAADRRAAAWYSAAAGAFLFLTYTHFWNGQVPALSWFTGTYPSGAAIFGFCAWLVVGAFLLRFVRDAVRLPAPWEAMFARVQDAHVAERTNRYPPASELR